MVRSVTRLGQAPPLGLEETVRTLEETLKTDDGGNVGGNISDEQRAQLAAWAKLYGKAARLCQKLEQDD